MEPGGRGVMKNFEQIANGLDVMPVALALQTHPHLWNAHRFRTTYTGTPHTDVDDILLRFSAPEKTADPDHLGDVLEDMEPVFYPAWQELPQVRPIVFDLMRRVEAVSLGRVIITRLQPGGRIAPHADTDGAYVASDGMRFHVVLQGLPGSLYHCGDEVVQMRTGTVWWFQHREVHSVENNSADDRIHLLVDFRR
jgi:hypothetical protein